MATEERPQQANKTAREQLTSVKRKRLDKLFQIAETKAAAATTPHDFDYATDLLAQCVTGDPGNAIFVRAYIENLQKKYGNNKKGTRLAQFQEWGSRNAAKKALAQEQWDEVIKHGLKVLTVNPWDVATLTAMATAAAKSGDRDCEVCYLKSALMGSPKDPACNRMFAIALTDRGLIDQAIAVWRRVEDALPEGDEVKEEAKRTIAVLTVQKARSRGEYDDDDDVSRKLRAKAQQQEEVTHEQKLLLKIKQEPKKPASYLELAQLYSNDERYAEAESLLAKAYQASGNDPDIREKWEDAQLRHLRQKISTTSDPDGKKKLHAEYIEKDLEVWKNRVKRFPNNLTFRYELGYRYMLAKQYSEAISELQAARTEPRKKGACMLVLGQCFQQIGQYRLAMTHYEEALREIPDREAESKKRVLYLAGRLAMSKHLNDLAAAERHLNALAGLDYGYKDVSALLDKLGQLRENPESGGGKRADAPQDK